MTKFWLITIFLFALSVESTAQTVFATETFQATAAPKGTSANGYIGDMGAWSVANTGTNGASSNNWYVSGEECGNAVGNCGTACPNVDNSLHVSAIGGLCGTPDCGAAYNETSGANQTNQRAISPTVDCAGYSNIELNFNFIAAQGDDGFIVEYSLDNGTTWTTFGGGNLAESGCCCFLAGWCTNILDPQPCSDPLAAQGYWTAANLVFPVGADNNSQVRFAFNWSNDGNGIGTDPSVAIDDITLTYGIILDNELTNFSVRPIGQYNQISWIAEKENEITKLYVEHSETGKEFMEVGEFEELKDISSMDHFIHSPTSVSNYYRIKTLKKTGDYEYSEIQKVTNPLNEIIVRSENGRFEILGLEKFYGKIEVIDLSGQQCTTAVPYGYDDDKISINSESLRPGIYIINIYTNESLIQKKVIKP